MRLLAAPLLHYESDRDSELLGRHLEIHVPRLDDGDLSVGTRAAHVEWTDSTRDIPSFGFDDTSTTSYWVRFRIENPHADPVEIYLASHYPATDALRLYEASEDQTLTLIEEQGDQRSYMKRSVHSRIPVFRIILTPGIHTYYLEQKSFAAIQFPLKVWRPEAFREFANNESLILGAIVGSCVFMLCSNFLIFIRFRSRAYLLYVFYTLSVCIYLSNFLGLTQTRFLPDVAGSWWLGEGSKINMDLLQLSAVAFATAFLDLKEHAPRLRRYFLFLMFLGVLTLLNTLTFKLWFNKQTAVFSMIVSFSLLGAGIYLFKRLSYARYYTFGWSFLLILNVATMLSLAGLISADIWLFSWGQSVGLCLELCLLSLALGERIARINQHREEALRELGKTKSNLFLAEQERVQIQSRLLEEREKHIEELDLKVEERTRDLRSILNTLHQGIFAIRLEGGRCLMDADYSPFLHEIFGAFDWSKEDPVELLLRHSLTGQDDQSRIRSIIVSMMDGDPLTFELNNGSLPREIDLALPTGEHKTLEIDWDPIVDHHGSIRKLLVAVRDLTEYKVLRNQLQKQREDVAIAKDLLRDDVPLQGTWIAKIARELQELLESHLRDEQKRISILGRLHSLKGDARTLNLSGLSEAIHEAESCLIQPGEEGRTSGMAKAAALARRYQDVCTTLENRFRDRGSPIDPAPTLLSQASATLEAILSAELAQVNRLAAELGKNAPRLLIDPTPLMLPPGVGDALRESFAHLLRNSLDHGLETTEERRRAGKAENGLISITIKAAAEFYELCYGDDGRGLDLSRLKLKALEKGIGNGQQNDQEAAALIFVPELSTRDAVSLVSGRGIGMDAVKTRIESFGGSIQLILGPGHSRDQGRSFALRIRVPKALDLPYQRAVSA